MLDDKEWTCESTLSICTRAGEETFPAQLFCSVYAKIYMSVFAWKLLFLTRGESMAKKDSYEERAEALLGPIVAAN